MIELSEADLFHEHLEAGCPGCDECLTDRPRERADRYRLIRANVIAKDAAERLRRHPNVCVYCGDLADHADHLVPRTWTGDALRELVLTVPACADCNVRIGDYCDPEIAARCEVVTNSLRRKHKKLLTQLPLGDLNGTEGKLKSALMARRHLRATVIGRLAVLAAGGFLELHENTRERITYHGIADLATERHEETAHDR